MGEDDARTATQMNKYTFHWTITPASQADYSVAVPPFDITLRETTLALTANSDTADEQRLLEQADQVAHDLARSLSYEYAERFDVAYNGCHVVTPTAITVKPGPAVISPSGTLDFEHRNAAGNVIDSSALRRERQRQDAQQRVTDLTKRAARDPNLRDMLVHWSRYAGDPDGRLHPLYDLLQLVECLYGGRKNAANRLAVSDADLDNLGRISNDETVLNGRHPGKSQGPHRVATESEVNTCERAARAILEMYASKIVV